MRASNTPILLVSPMSSSLSYEAILRRNNFLNVSRCADPISALQFLEKNPAHIVISETDMNDMDGFELASHLREIERTEGRYSYVILVGDNSVHNNAKFKSQALVDAIVPRDQLPLRLVPQVMSGERISVEMNRLLGENRELGLRCNQLEVGQLLDPVTGLGNRQQAIRGMEDMIRQIEARGGAISLLAISIRNLARLEQEHSAAVVNELLVAMAGQIKRLVRPLDLVTYFGDGLYAVVMRHNRLKDCCAESYERLYSGVALKHFPTRAGFINPRVVIGACGASAECGPPKIDRLIDDALANLETATGSGQLTVSVLNEALEIDDEPATASLTR